MYLYHIYPRYLPIYVVERCLPRRGAAAHATQAQRCAALRSTAGYILYYIISRCSSMKLDTLQQQKKSEKVSVNKVKKIYK